MNTYSKYHAQLMQSLLSTCFFSGDNNVEFRTNSMIFGLKQDLLRAQHVFELDTCGDWSLGSLLFLPPLYAK